MSMDDFVKTLSEQQKKALLKALSGGTFELENVPDETKAKEHGEEDFTMSKKKTAKSQPRRKPVRAGENTYVDTGEHKDIVTPETTRTPRQRPKPNKKNVKCHVCGKTFAVDTRYSYGDFQRCNNCVG